MSQPTSVLTLASGREDHLRNQISGLRGGSQMPGELVVVCMNGWRPGGLGDPGFPLRTIRVEQAGGGLPLAAARNAAARAARWPGLIFLDVDCVPDRGLVEAYAEGLSGFGGILMGDVAYLPPGAGDGFSRTLDYEGLARRGTSHPSRRCPPGDGPHPTDRYEQFWSLSFAVRREVFFERAEGFDEAFTGYGGEDTDFAFAAREAGVPLAWQAGARAFHQHHETCDPPVQHLDDIARNARRFRRKWGRWPMEGWLSEMARMGLIEWSPQTLRVLRQPTPDELDACRRLRPLRRTSPAPG